MKSISAMGVAWLCLNDAAFAEQVTVAADGNLDDDDCEDTQGLVDWGVCLLQNQHFMRKFRAAGDDHAGGSQECPGHFVEENAQLDKCSYEGVAIVTGDGTAIIEFFDDNVQMKDFHWYINGIPDVWINLETHPFHVGTTVVTVEGRDLAGNKRQCHRTVKVTDTQRPKWEVNTASVDSDITIYVDDSCSKTATSIFSEYEDMGWSASGSDNCGVAGVTKQILKEGKVIYDDSVDGNDLIEGPGTYELVYVLTDINGLTVTHTVVLHLEDNSPPTEIDGCPEENIFVEIEAGVTTGETEWTIPYVTRDNCLKHGTPPIPVEVSGKGIAHGTETTMRRGKFEIGDHQIAYPVYDAFGNLYHEECKFIIEVKEKAHNVKLTCPADVVVNTFDLTDFGAPTWPAPTATQGDKVLSADHISYLNGAAPGLPFLYGETTVTVRAQGEVTGTKTHEDEQSDECTFHVKVNDPFRPFVDGRRFRCAAETQGVEPYGVCDGTNIKVTLHTGYEDTGGYDLAGAEPRTGPCCGDEHGTAYACTGGESALWKYCKPATPS